MKLRLLLLLLAGSTLLFGEFLRMPAPSPDGSMIAFSARGNLWVAGTDGGTARQITSHPAYDGNPIWSPDGTKIAFSSDRRGNDDIYVINADGTGLRELTYLSADDTPCDWSPDGKSILFSSRRDFGWHWQPSLYTVSVEGGMPHQVIMDFGIFGTYNPDGTKITYIPRRDYYYTKGYTGGAQMDIFLYDIPTGRADRLTKWKGDDVHAMWLPDGSGFYYISDHDRVSNLWFYSLADKGVTQKTFYKTGDITFPRIARNGSLIAFEYDGGVVLFDTATGKSRPLNVTIGEDDTEDPVVWKRYSSHARSFALDNENEEIAFSVHGDIFIKRLLDDAATHALTATPSLEEDLLFGKKGEVLYAVTDEKGNKDIVRYLSDDPAEKRLAYALKTKREVLAGTPDDESDPILSPDGKTICFVINSGDLALMDVDGKNRRVLVKGWNVKTFSFSPDGRFIAFSREDNDFNEDIYIVKTGGGEPINITRHPAYDTNPVWSPDGKYIAFLSNRLDYGFDVYTVWLTKAEEEKTEEMREDEAENKKKAKKKDEPKGEKKKKRGKRDTKKEEEPKVKVAIDFDRIWLRPRRLTELPGNESDLAISGDSKKVVFVSDNEGENDLYVIKRTGKDLKRLTTGGSSPTHLTFARDGKTLYYLNEGGSIQSINIDTKKKKGIKFSASLQVNRNAERLEVFKEGWAILNRYYYDPKFNGLDWKGMLNHYLPLVSQAPARRDFDSLMWRMLGELNGSHLGIYPPGRGSHPQTGRLGIAVEEGYAGPGVKVASIIPKSPADSPTHPLKPGDVIEAIDGRPLPEHCNLYRFLYDRVGRRVALTVKRGGKEILLGFIPCSPGHLRGLIYDAYVEKMRSYVNKLSNGRLAYLHIRYMDKESYERFQMELYSVAYGKDGIIIDVRNNGGGWTTDILLKLLATKPHAYTIPRGGGRGYPDFERVQVYTWQKPFIVLCNEDSFSNAEIFSHAIKTLKLATLVGTETNGSVISTDGTELLDGSYFRIPTRGWYVYGTGVNMEEQGAVPDAIVENPPEIWGKRGEDLQVSKAVEILLGQIDAHKEAKP